MVNQHGVSDSMIATLSDGSFCFERFYVVYVCCGVFKVLSSVFLKVMSETCLHEPRSSTDKSCVHRKKNPNKIHT